MFGNVEKNNRQSKWLPFPTPKPDKENTRNGCSLEPSGATGKP